MVDAETAAWLLFATGVAAAMTALVVRYPPRWPGFLALAGFMVSWLAGELVWHTTLLWWGLGALWLAEGGAHGIGLVGLALLLTPLDAILRSRSDARQLEHAARTRFGARWPASLEHPTWSRMWFFLFHTRNIRREKIAYGPERSHVADLYRPCSTSEHSAATLIYVHGGGWVMGFRRWQGRILFRRLVARGWTVISVEYRLSPLGTWPAPIHDVKRAIAWVKEHPDITGWRPGRLAIAGNSAGGHLASLAAMTCNLPEFQPGFEHSDTSVDACQAWYGVHDIIDRHRRWRHRGLKHLWELLIAKRRFETDPSLFRAASPLEHALGGRPHPPFCLIHGTNDSLVPPINGRDMADTLGDATFIEVPGAQHAFDVFWSPRAVTAVEMAALWLEQTISPVPSPPTAA